MNRYLIFVMSIVCGLANGQRFVRNHEVILPDTLSNSTIEVADMNNDGLQDIVLFASNASHEHVMMFILGDTVSGAKLSEQFLSADGFNAYTLYDYDNDNFIDILFSGSTGTRFYRNKGNLLFDDTPLSLPKFERIYFLDANYDGLPECVLSDVDGPLKTFEKNVSGAWVMTTDTLNVSLTDLQATDFNGDGFNDLFLSGRSLDTDSTFGAIFSGTSKGDYKLWFTDSLAGKSILVDEDGTGFPDLVVYGVYESGLPGYKILRHGAAGAITQEDLGSAEVLAAFWADFDSDGEVDRWIAYTQNSDTVNLVSFADGSTEVLPHKGLSAMLPIDLEHDGDLDMVNLLNGGELSVVIMENMEPRVNSSPSAPKEAIAIPIYDRLLFHWENADDDHTVQASITYDLYFSAPPAGYCSDFDLINSRRLRVNHGNSFTSNFKLLKKVNSSNLQFAVQSIDNAFFSGEKGVCVGGGLACAEMKEQRITACAGEGIQLNEEHPVKWFSFSKGYLGEFASLQYAAEQDTLFSLSRKDHCFVIKTYLILLKETVNSSESIYACEGTNVPLAVPNDWAQVHWTSRNTGVMDATAQLLDYKVLEEDVVTATFTKSQRCKYVKSFHLNLSFPDLRVAPVTSEIAAGASVQYVVEGASSYSWYPADFLDDPNSANPVATPWQDVVYTVTGSDSLGCTKSVTVSITVNAQGFLPSLFTPNADGKNDQLRIYGLTGAENFSIRVMNRDGSTVFSSNNINELVQSGWDGTSNGIKQPNGVYYWRVEGLINGKELLLNGRKEGSVTLIR